MEMAVESVVYGNQLFVGQVQSIEDTLTFKLGNCKSVTGQIKNNVFDCPNYTAVYCITSSNGGFALTVSDNTIYANNDRGNEEVMRCGKMVDNKNPDAVKAINEVQLLQAFKTFDASPKKVQWME